MLSSAVSLLLLVQGPQLAKMVNPAEAGAGGREIARVCGLSAALTVGELLSREGTLSDEVRKRSPKARSWAELACVRAILDTRGAASREGPELPLGEGWLVGAARAASRAISVDISDSPSASILALVGLRQIPGTASDRLLTSLSKVVASGMRQPEVLRACAELMVQAKRDSLARTCATFGLEAGHDSTWHQLRLARLDTRRHDSTNATLHLSLAMLAARDSAAIAEVMWHLQWFLSPDEMDRFKTVPVSQLSAWVQLRLVARDIRDGRPIGSRLAAHFERMDYVFEHFTLDLADVVRRKGGFIGSTPDAGGGVWNILKSAEPGAVAAGVFRFYSRWQTDIDDRGVVYMRFGEPQKRFGLRLGDNLRELWWYEIDGRPLLLNFEGERFDGREEATRLVGGVLGSYMCGIDTLRCSLTERSQMAASKRFGEENPLPYTAIVPVQEQDAEFIKNATTRDDNSPRGLKPISIVAALYRMWDPESGVPLSVVAVRAPSADTGQLAFRVAQLDAGSGNLRDTSLTAMSSTVLALSRANDVTTWSVIATRDKAMGRSWEDGMPPLPTGPIRMSDVILGAKGASLAWNATGTRVPIHLGSFERKLPIQVYYQVRSQISRPSATSVVTVVPEDPGAKPERQSLRIEAQSALNKGLTEVERELDLSRLTGKRYRIEIAITDAGGTVRVKQVVRVELK